MRAEDKQLEGPELEKSAEQREQIEAKDSVEREEEELPVLAGEEVRDIELEHRSRIFDALRLIIAREQLTVSLLGLPKRETQALEALQTAVSGRDVHMNEFVFAEDRKVLLEQALAVLQANLTYGDAAELAELHGKYEELVSEIGELRERLASLEDAQDDLIDEKRVFVEKKDDDEEDDDKQDDDEDASDQDGALEGVGQSEQPEQPEPEQPEQPEQPELELEKAQKAERAEQLEKRETSEKPEPETFEKRETVEQPGAKATAKLPIKVGDDASLTDLVGAALLAYAGGERPVDAEQPGSPPPEPPKPKPGKPSKKPPLNRRGKRG